MKKKIHLRTPEKKESNELFYFLVSSSYNVTLLISRYYTTKTTTKTTTKPNTTNNTNKSTDYLIPAEPIIYNLYRIRNAIRPVKRHICPIVLLIQKSRIHFNILDISIRIFPNNLTAMTIVVIIEHKECDVTDLGNIFIKLNWGPGLVKEGLNLFVG